MMDLRMMRRRALAVLTTLMVVCTLGYASDSRYVRLTILHTNDTHSHLLPFSYPSTLMVENDDATTEHVTLGQYKDIGGIARRATLISRIEAQGQPVLVMDAGDLIDGSPFSIEFAGEADFTAAREAGYDVAVTGNHEYSNKIDNFMSRIHEARFPVLGANVYAKDGSQFLPPYVIKEEGGLRIAILGLVTPNTYTAVKEAGLTIKDPIESAKEWVPTLRQFADVVICLTHIGIDVDRKLAAQVPGIDVIIGGHSHTRLEKPVLIKRNDATDAFSVGGTVIAQDFQWGGDLGEVDLTFHKGDAGWTLMRYDGKLIPVTPDIPEDPEVRAVVEKFHSKIAAKYDVVIGRASADFILEAPINMVSDAMRETAGADFAMQNYGGVRTDIVEGPITLGDIAMLFPFGNGTLTFEATGAQIKAILAKGTPAVSNIKYEVRGGKLVSAELGGSPIEDAKVYKGVTHTFYASSVFPEIKTTDMGLRTRDLISNYIKAKKTISPDPERRAKY